MHPGDELRPEIAMAFFSRFSDLTDTQKDSISPILQGEDTLIISGTGSGKTEAVLAPLISRYFDKARISDQVQIIYLAPTKALVNDVAKRIVPVFNSLEMGVVVRHGDKNQLNLKQKHTLLITTPESLEVLLATKPSIFMEVNSIVIDEAHLLFNQQRGFQLAIEIDRLEKLVSRRLQVVAASATVSSPYSLWKFFRPNNTFKLTQQIGQREIRSQIRIGYNYEDLVKMISNLPDINPLKILVFGDTKREIDAIALRLQESKTINSAVFSHHASLSPEMRKTVESAFNEKTNAICVATSTLELGIDIGDINLVILWGKARNWQSFLQRIGRGNRRSNFSEVICVLPKENMENFSDLFGFQSLLEQIHLADFPKQEPFELYGVIVQQICVIASAKESGFLSSNYFFETFKSFDFIKKEDLDELLLHMTEIGILVKDPHRMAFGPSEKIHDLRDKNLLWSNIPHSSSTVPLVLGSMVLGNISSSNLFKLNVGSVFAFAAKRLRVVSLNGGEIIVTETKETINSQVKFGGSPQSVEVSLLAALKSYIKNGAYNSRENVYPKSRFTDLADEVSRLFTDCILDSQIPFFMRNGKYCYITFGGMVLNKALSSYVGNLAEGSNDFLLVSNKKIDFSTLPSALGQYSEIISNLDLTQGGKTEYQDFLTPHLKALENLSKWNSESYYEITLKWLVESLPFEIESTDMFSWS